MEWQKPLSKVAYWAVGRWTFLLIFRNLREDIEIKVVGGKGQRPELKAGAVRILFLPLISPKLGFKVEG